MENVNGLAAYVRSITRAAGFRDLRPRLRQVLLGEDEEVTAEHRHLNHHETNERSDGHAGREQSPSSFENTDGQQSNRHPSEQTPLLNDRSHSNASSDGFAELAPLRSKVHGSSSDRIEELARQRDETRAQMKDDEREPLLITKVRRDDGTEAEVIVGQSTLPQTIFNSSNTLVGVGILSLPLGIKYAGWVLGLTGLLRE
jgi:solute carrier family 32 (vesicular inhibitory amino acid transporter)